MEYDFQSCIMLYRFLTAVRGNWRNSIYIHCTTEKNNDFLLAPNVRGIPIIVPARMIEEMQSGSLVLDECIVEMDCCKIKSLYHQWIFDYLEADSHCIYWGLYNLYN